jgi:hypothetical protein
MIDAGTHHGKADSDIDPRLQAEHLDRTVALIVVHGDHQVKVPPPGQEEHGVGG